LSTPIAIQNVTTGEIPANAVQLTCTKAAAAPGQQTITTNNNAAIPANAAFYFNPVVDTTTFPDGWYGSCVVNTGTHDTAVFVQMRFVAQGRAAAYEALPSDSTDTTVVIPLYAKRLANGFASAVTVQNLTGNPANVTLNYQPGDGAPATCAANFARTIPANESLIQNHRVPNDQANSVPELADGCFGTLTVTSDQPIGAFVQLDFLNDTGDPFMAHTAFTVAN
jgi:hypothetical protein